MSLYTARQKLLETLIISELPPPEKGIPSSYKSGPYPRMYFDIPSILPTYGALQAVEVTSEISQMRVLIVFNSGQEEYPIPAGVGLDDYMVQVAATVQQKMMDDTASGVYLEDGDGGFRAEIGSMNFDFGLDDPIGVAILIVKFSQYRR